MTFPSLAPKIGGMTVTPLYTVTELDAEIAQAKLDLAAARKLLAHSSDHGGSRIQIQREQVKSLQDHLVWLQEQRATLQLGSAAGHQQLVGRPTR